MFPNVYIHTALQTNVALFAVTMIGTIVAHLVVPPVSLTANRVHAMRGKKGGNRILKLVGFCNLRIHQHLQRAAARKRRERDSNPWYRL